MLFFPHIESDEVFRIAEVPNTWPCQKFNCLLQKTVSRMEGAGVGKSLASYSAKQNRTKKTAVAAPAIVSRLD